jgi:hypothetical protein
MTNQELLEKIAEWQIAFDDRIDKAFKPLSDAKLKAFVRHCAKEAKNSVGFEAWSTTIQRKAEVALMLRYGTRRAIKLKAECYCFYHDCDSINCPNDGSH